MCITPITIRKGTPDQMTVGCGSCAPCFMKYTNQWGFRIAIHANTCVTHYCVTLTYDGANLPYVISRSKILRGKKYDDGREIACLRLNADPNDESGTAYMTLVRAHASLFMKTLRNKTSKRYGKNAPKISYIICGEYGDRFKRPHYHAIIFNAHIDDILSSWDRGSVFFGANNVDGSVRYALKYVVKSRLWRYENNRSYARPFVNFSKGLGESLICTARKRYQYVDTQTGEIKSFTIRCLKTDSLPENITYGKYSLMLPRYYADKLDQKIDTDALRELAIEKNRANEKTIADNGLTPLQWRKQYRKWLYSLKRDDMYSNVLLNTENISSIASYSK